MGLFGNCKKCDRFITGNRVDVHKNPHASEMWCCSCSGCKCGTEHEDDFKNLVQRVRKLEKEVNTKQLKIDNAVKYLHLVLDDLDQIDGIRDAIAMLESKD